MQKQQLFFDTECYPNYFLLVFKDLKGNEECFVKDENNVLPVARIRKLLETRQTIGFNSRMYDIPMITYALSGVSNSLLKEMSNSLIPDKKLVEAGLVDSTFNVIKKNNLWCPFEYDHIDIINVAHGVKAGLKIYGARIGSRKLQDLPYNHLEPLSQEQKKDVKTYCINDVDLTADLFKYLHKELAVRELLNKEYNVDSRSKSDAQIAELLFEKKVASSGKKVKSFDFKYVAPEYINFKTDILKRFTDIEFKGIIGDEILKEGVIEDVVINGTEYSCGIGGLHSKENKRFIKASDDEYLIDVDVVSYYPTIILNNGYCPEYYIKEDFLKFYQKIYHDRVIAKKEGDKDKSEVYKIILNGSFGKFGDKFSKLYSPKLLIHTTITGQLSVLMLIEKLEEYGYKVISSNTDGIAVIVKKNKYDFFKKIVKSWEDKVKFTTEEVRYSALYNHSVNSYIAVKEDGSLKLKGTFAESAINKNINAPICKKAVINYITRDIAIEDTILKTKHNPLDLIKMRKVKNGGYWKGEYLGKIVRWYWSTKGEPITNPKGDKVAGTDDAFPIMDMGDGIKDLHYDRYIKESYKLLSWIGIKI